MPFRDHDTVAALDRLHAADGGWYGESLVQRDARPPELPSIGGLIYPDGLVYPAKRTLFSGETESLKTWLALILAKSEMDDGLPVGWVDLDAMGPGALLERLRALGASDEAIDELFLYYEPFKPFGEDICNVVCEAISKHGMRLFVGDAFNPWLHLHGLDPNKTVDVETFWRDVADPITDAGAALLMLDHVAKSADGRGKYAYGSERKASGAALHIGFERLTAFNRNQQGSSVLVTHKDRPGFLPTPKIGRLVMTPGDIIEFRIEPDMSHTSTYHSFRPTVLMERVSKRLENESGARSLTWVETNIEGKTNGLRIATEVLASEGHLIESEGPRGSRLFTSIRPYREGDDSLADDHIPFTLDETFLTTTLDPVPQPRPTPSPSPSPGSTTWFDSVPDPVPDPDENVNPRPRPSESAEGNAFQGFPLRENHPRARAREDPGLGAGSQDAFTENQSSVTDFDFPNEAGAPDAGLTPEQQAAIDEAIRDGRLDP